MEISSSHSRPPPAPTLMPYRVRVCGRIQNNVRHRSPGTWHEDAMLLVFISGRGIYRVGTVENRVAAPCLGLILPESPRGILMADPVEPYDHIYCRFAGQFGLEAARRIAAGLSARAPFSRPFEWESIVRSALSLVAMSGMEQGAGLERMRPVDAELAKLLAILDCAELPVERGLSSERIRHYIRSRISAPADLRHMADYFAVSRAYLCRKVSEVTGCSPMKLLNREKMIRARELLEHREFSIGEVAACVGFADANYFAKVYRKHFGHAPRDSG